jgi:curved DNA-binding protein CbpA
MTSVITWYDVLGVLPDAPPDDIREAWQVRTSALEPGKLAGAPPEVLSAADRARRAVQEAWRVLGDPAARQSYDQRIGFRRPGEGLPPSSWGPPDPDAGLGEGWPATGGEAGPYPSRSSRVVVPDVRGLFYGACMDVAGRVGLRVAPIQLTRHPTPVEGLVVGQNPASGKRMHRDSTLTIQVWHPSEPGSQQTAAPS